MTPVSSWRDEVVGLIPALRAFAWSSRHDGSDADDLVQDPDQGLDQPGEVRARRQPQSLAVHDPAQHLGTVKSRVNRARARLLKLVHAEDAADVMALETMAVAGRA